MLENIPYHFHENTYIYFVVTHWPILNDTFNLLSLPSWLASILNSLPKNYNKTNKSLVLRYKNYYCMFNVWKLSLMAYYFEKKKTNKGDMIFHSRARDMSTKLRGRKKWAPSPSFFKLTLPWHHLLFSLHSISKTLSPTFSIWSNWHLVGWGGNLPFEQPLLQW